jgi:integrase
MLRGSGTATGFSAGTKKTAISPARPRWAYKFRMHICAPLVASEDGCGGEQPIEPTDPFLLRDAVTLLIDCVLRPGECFRLRWEYVRDGSLNIPFGKTENARRAIPLSERAAQLIEARRAVAKSDWVFPAPTKSEHIEKSMFKKPHAKSYTIAKIASFPLYTFRHTCLTHWAAHMDPYTLGYLAGHSDFSTSKRYINTSADCPGSDGTCTSGAEWAQDWAQTQLAKSPEVPVSI